VNGPDLSLNLQVKFREFSEKEIRKNRELNGNLGWEIARHPGQPDQFKGIVENSPLIW